jgi:8-oxo-dGTP pyrophosphatase MutT (NUDIX family)
VAVAATPGLIERGGAVVDGGRAPEAEYAVLVPIIAREGVPCVLLTKRLDTLPEYSGHVSFPGGARDPADRDLIATAIRETFEEVGISPERIDVLRELPQRVSGLGHRVKPYLARVAPGPVSPNPLEVDRLLFLPVSLLSDPPRATPGASHGEAAGGTRHRRGRYPDPFGTRTWKDPAGKIRTTFTLVHDGLEIWGLTARILQGCCAEGLFKKETPTSLPPRDR